MAFLISHDDTNYIEIVATSNVTYPATQEMIHTVIQISKNNSATFFFFNFSNFEIAITPFETYELFQYVSRQHIEGPFKIAFVHTLDSYRKDHYHAENVGSNNGILIRAFPDEDQAKKWLFSDMDKFHVAG